MRVQSREGGGRDVAHGVAAGLAKGDVARFELGPQLRAVLQLHVVNLDVLTGGQVVLPCAVFVAHVEDGPELVKRQQAHRDLDADHLNAGLTLTIHPAGKAKAAKTLLVELAFPEQQDPTVQVEDVSLDDGVVDFVDETEHDVLCLSSVVQQKRPPVREAFVESDAGISSHDATANLPVRAVGQQQQHAMKKAFGIKTIPSIYKTHRICRVSLKKQIVRDL